MERCTGLTRAARICKLGFMVYGYGYGYVIEVPFFGEKGRVLSLSRSIYSHNGFSEKYTLVSAGY